MIHISPDMSVVNSLQFTSQEIKRTKAMSQNSLEQDIDKLCSYQSKNT